MRRPVDRRAGHQLAVADHGRPLRCPGRRRSGRRRGWRRRPGRRGAAPARRSRRRSGRRRRGSPRPSRRTPPADRRAARRPAVRPARTPRHTRRGRPGAPWRLPDALRAALQVSHGAGLLEQVGGGDERGHPACRVTLELCQLEREEGASERGPPVLASATRSPTDGARGGRSPRIVPDRSRGQARPACGRPGLRPGSPARWRASGVGSTRSRGSRLDVASTAVTCRAKRRRARSAPSGSPSARASSSSSEVAVAQGRVSGRGAASGRGSLRQRLQPRAAGTDVDQAGALAVRRFQSAARAPAPRRLRSAWPATTITSAESRSAIDAPVAAEARPSRPPPPGRQRRCRRPGRRLRIRSPGVRLLVRLLAGCQDCDRATAEPLQASSAAARRCAPARRPRRPPRGRGRRGCGWWSRGLPPAGRVIA